LEKEIAALESEKENLVEKLNSGGSHIEITEWSKEIDRISKLVEQKTERWLELEEKAV
jgi:ABC transport system ATP-binding/permease protein